MMYLMIWNRSLMTTVEIYSRGETGKAQNTLGILIETMKT